MKSKDKEKVKDAVIVKTTVNEVDKVDTNSNNIFTKKNIITGCSVIGALVVVSLIIFMFNKDNDSEVKDPLLSGGAFVFETEDGNKLLFDEDGKKIIDKKFIDTERSFVNNGLIVQDEDGKYGIISNDGKMIVNYGEYTSIIRKGPLYQVSTDQIDERMIIDGDGKRVVKLYDSKEEDFANVREVMYGTLPYVIVEFKNEIVIFDIDGKVFLEFDRDSEDDKVEVLDGEGNYFTFNYKDKSYLVDYYANEVVEEFNDKLFYKVTWQGYDDKNIVVLVGKTNGNKDTKIVYIYDNKLKYKIDVNKDAKVLFREPFVLVNEVLIKSNGEKGSFNDQYNPILGEDYVLSETEEGINFVNGDKVIKTKCERIATDDGYVNSGYVILKNCNGKDDYKIYSSKGKLVSTIDEVSKVYDFNDDGYAKVKELNDKHKYKYYMIDAKGKMVTDKYDEISSLFYHKDNDHYKACNGDKCIVLDSNFKVVKEGVVDGDTRNFVDNEAILKTKDKQTLVSVKDLKVLIELDKDSDVDFKKYWIEVKSGELVEYYTYNTYKKFHEE